MRAGDAARAEEVPPLLASCLSLSGTSFIPVYIELLSQRPMATQTAAQFTCSSLYQIK